MNSNSVEGDGFSSPVEESMDPKSVEEVVGGLGDSTSRTQAMETIDPESLADENQPKVSYIPDAIPQEREMPNHKSYFVHKLACVTISVLAMVAVVGGVCGSGHCSSSKSVVATSAPTSYRSSLLLEFESKIEDAFGSDYFHPDSQFLDTRRKALNWLLQEDPMQLESSAENLLQRYILAFFYFNTSKKGPWRECDLAGPKLCYPYITGDHRQSSTPENSWLSDNHECLWAQVACEGYGSEGNRAVTSIRIYDNGLHGPIPTELVKLANMTELTISGNSMTGTIPTELAELSLLRGLRIDDNSLEGGIPPELFTSMPALKFINFNRNSLTGTIPTEVQFFDQGKFLVFAGNGLTGSLPTEIYSLSNLDYLIVSRNDITGTIATEIAKMGNLTYLDLRDTLLSGSIPSEVALLGNLGLIYLTNTPVWGTLPEELYTMSSLMGLYISNCAFTGTISTNIGVLSNLEVLKMAYNSFDGTIPKEIQALSNLRKFSVQGNGFTGTFPQSVCTNLVDGMLLTPEVVADCLLEDDTGVASMECECCTQCCSAQTGICREVWGKK